MQRIIKINKVKCISQYGDCPSSLIFPQSGDYLSIKNVSRKILEQNLLVTDYLIQYQLPQTVKIEIIVNRPIFAVKTSQNNYFLVNKEYYVVGQSEKKEFPTVYYSEYPIGIGQRLDEDVVFALNVLKGINWLYSIDEINVKENELEFKYDNQILVRLPKTGDIDFILGSIRLIFSRLNDNKEGIRINNIKELDLRFKNPVLR